MAKAFKHSTMKSNSRRGSILIAVLWSLFFLASLALVINSLITPQLTLAAKLRERALLRTVTEAAVKRAIIEIRTDETEDYDGLNELWFENEEAFKEINFVDDAYFSVKYTLVDEDGEHSEQRYGFIDEERKININTVGADVLNEFFEIVGKTSAQDAEDITDAIIDWRDEDNEPLDNGAESSYYDSLNPGYDAKNAPFGLLEELFLVKGMTQDIFNKVEHHLTVYGDGKVNINTAGSLILQSLGMDSSLADKIIAFRQGDDGEEGTEDDTYFEEAENITSVLSASQGLSVGEIDTLNTIVGKNLITVRSDHFRGYAYGSLQDLGIDSEIVFVFNRDEQIRYWREY